MEKLKIDSRYDSRFDNYTLHPLQTKTSKLLNFSQTRTLLNNL